MPETTELMIAKLVEVLNDDKFEKNLIDSINDDIEIPMLNEKTEKKIFKKLVKILKDQLVVNIKDFTNNK